ncbi:MAG: hypothetical protein WBQ34_02280 [Candidatus Acidiferrales bacterium]
MRTTRRAGDADRVLSPQGFERLLQRAEAFQKIQKPHGPQLLGKLRPSPKRAASAA